MSPANPITVFLVLTAISALAGPANCCSADRPIITPDVVITCTRKSDNLIDVQINCRTNQAWSSLPRAKLQLDEDVLVVIRNCSFHEGLSLLNATKELGLVSVRDVKFEDSLGNLSREHLKGFKLNSLEFLTIDAGDLPADLLYDIKSLRQLYIVNATLKLIPEDFFKRSANLSYLEIVDNQLGKLNRNDLEGLANLTELLLFNNEIVEIESGTFDHLTKLQLLELSLNRLRTLPQGLFSKLVQLEVLNLNLNELDYVPDDLLRIEGSRLKRVRLSHNAGALVTLPSGFFGNLSNLNYAELMNNNFTSLPEDVFVGTSSLRELNLSYNVLKSLPPKIFESSRKLMVLHLSNNSLESLPAGVFQNANLEQLYLDYNQLTVLSPDILTGLANLKKLDVSHNNLTHIFAGEHCEHLHKLEFINLSYNELVFGNATPFLFLSSLLDCNMLKELDLSYNQLPVLYDDWQYDPTLKNIDLEGNKVTDLDAKGISLLQANGRLNLRNNLISTIDLSGLQKVVDDFVRDNQSLKKNSTIQLDNNPLHCDCKLVDFFRYVENRMNVDVYNYVHLETGNLRCTAPAQFANLPISQVRSEQLSCLVRSIEPRDACHETCICRDYPAKQLLSVNCSRKNLTNVPEFIDNANNRSIELDLSGNMLRETPALNSSYLLNVTSLDLSNNNISTVSLEIFSKRLRKLKLHGNRISRLSAKVLKYLSAETSLSNLTLHDNRWNCDCEAGDFLTVVQKKHQTIPALDDVRCYGTNRKLATLISNELCRDKVALIVSLSLTVAFIGLVLGVLAAAYYKHQKEIKIWLFSKQWCLWFVTEDELDRDKQYDAFISYSHKDEDFVDREIVAKLEEGPRPYKLCLHYRDWLAGEWIPAQIARSVSESRRTIVVLSPNFIESEWGRMEFRTAHSQALSEGRARVIVILYGDIGNTEDLDPELKAYLSMNTYVKWGDPWFLDKLRYALPHRYETSRRRTRNARIIENHLAQLPMNNHNGHEGSVKAEIIPMPKITANNDSAKLLDSRAEDGRGVAAC